MRIAKKI